MWIQMHELELAWKERVILGGHEGYSGMKLGKWEDSEKYSKNPNYFP